MDENINPPKSDPDQTLPHSHDMLLNPAKATAGLQEPEEKDGILDRNNTDKKSKSLGNRSQYIQILMVTILLMLFFGIAYFKISFQKPSQENSEIFVQSEATATPPFIPPTLLPTDDSKMCNESDKSFCTFMYNIIDLIEKQDFDSLLKNQKVSSITCTGKGYPDDPGICENQPKGKVLSTYNLAVVDSDGGGPQTEEAILKEYADRFSGTDPYQYFGYKMEKDTPVIIYTNKQQANQSSLLLEKINGTWKIGTLRVGYIFPEDLLQASKYSDKAQ